jgi:ubiquinone/menaquinone biosynthesis C-methylase UbiE
MEVLERDFNTNKVKSNFAKVAPIYDVWALVTETKAGNRTIELCKICDGMNLLEVAVGTGALFRRLVQLNPSGTNTGIDLSHDMLGKTENKLKRRKLKNYTLLECNALDLELKDSSIDILVNNFMIDMLPVPYFDKVIAEFYRVLRPGGIVVISTFSYGYKNVHKFWHWIARNYPGMLLGCRPIDLKENLEKAGFLVEHEEQISQNTFPAKIISARK